MKAFESFSNLYSTDKTLRFELRPVGQTLSFIEKKGFIQHDEQRADSYKKVKTLIDEYHKQYISCRLQDFQLQIADVGKLDSLSEYLYYYRIPIKSEQEKKAIEKIQKNLRKQIASRLKAGEEFKNIANKNLFKVELPDFIKDKELLEHVHRFDNFTTYFTNFHENRKNMYSDEEKSTAIAYRLIHENLPRFIDNMKSFEKIIKTGSLSSNLSTLYTDFEEYLNVESIADLFELDYFNDTLTQEQIEVYNAIVGGRSEGNGLHKIQGLNEYINLYNQKQSKENRLPKLKILYKQILSDREAISWLPEEFPRDKKADNVVLEAIEQGYRLLEECVFSSSDDRLSLKQLLAQLNNYQLRGIYLRNDRQLASLSQQIFGDWSVIQRALERAYEIDNPKKSGQKIDKYEEVRNKSISSRDGFSIEEINRALLLLGEPYSGFCIEKYFISLGAVSFKDAQTEDFFERVDQAYNQVKDVLNTSYPENKRMAQDKFVVNGIKSLLDAIKDLQYFVRPLLGNQNEISKDENFYGEFISLWDELNKFSPLYDKVRNYITRKLYSTEKIKLNFDAPTLLDGWDLNKEKDNCAVILRKKGLYYLGIIDKKHNKIFEKKNFGVKGSEYYEKMEYKFFKDVTTMIPKCSTQLNEVIAHFEGSDEPYVLYNPKNFSTPLTITREIYDLNNKTYGDGKGYKKFQKEYLVNNENDKEGFAEAVSKWISFCMEFIRVYKSTTFYDLSSLRPLYEYQFVDEFYKEINKLLYHVQFREIPKAYVDGLVEEGKLYLFTIYNKDFSPYSKGTPNLHTLYWKALFDEYNLQDVIYKLNGQAEVFFRQKSIEPHITHPAGQPIAKKNKCNLGENSLFDFDLIKDKRYSVDKFQFHVPLTLNFKSEGVKNINQVVFDYVREQDDMHVIGIDRGERHLLYLTVIDKYGNIKEQETLNLIANDYQGRQYKTDYHDLLNQKESGRDQARKDWQAIENIKELKEGYLSHVVHKITELMIKYNAIVVLEDLNMGFKRSRQRIEKQVYQKFEKKLIDKLNYLVQKNADPLQSGGLFKAYQLTNKFESFRALGKQSGFLFYTAAWNTSKMDPVTGFVNLLDTRYESVDKARSFLDRFDDIRYNVQRGYFEFQTDYSRFTTKADGTRVCWTICSYGERIENFRDPKNNNQWESREIVLPQAFIRLFESKGIDWNGSLKKEILKQDDKSFWAPFLHLLHLTLQMRNSHINSEVDYIISPIADEHGVFFDSRKGNSSLPLNADANGAYNIARKGLWIIDQIKKAKDPKKPELFISNKDWLAFAQHKPYLEKD